MVIEGQRHHQHHHQNQKHFDKEIREMVSAITHRLTDLQKSGAGAHHQDVDDEHGLRIITLAGTNSGATLRSELEEKSTGVLTGGGETGESDDALSTFVNSNFQSVNNSIMMGGSYSTNDPGVHVDISDVFEPPPEHKKEKKGSKGKKKDHKSGRSEHSD